MSDSVWPHRWQPTRILCSWDSSGKNTCLEWVAISFSNACMLSCFSHVQLFVMLWIVAHQAPLSIGFSRQEYWNGLPYPSPGDLPDPGIEPMSLALAGGFFITSTTWDYILLWVLLRKWFLWYKKLEAKTSLWKLAFPHWASSLLDSRSF